VAEVDDPSRTLDALRGLGVTGRAEFTAENRNILSHLREDGQLLHLYLYHFLYETGEPTDVEVALPGLGTAHRIDPWTGEIRPHQGVRYDGDRTLLSVRLAPGETALLTLDRSASHPVASAPPVVDTVTEITQWSITVESWDAGELETITEDRGLGYQTREVRPTTAITRIDTGTGPLQPWKDIPAVGPEVSGVGEYMATLTLPHEQASDGRYLLDLGSTAGGLGAVRINDGPLRGFDTSHPQVDITDDLRPGDNTLLVRVSSSLNNRLLARGYYDNVLDLIGSIIRGGPPQTQKTWPHAHGLLGPVQLLRQTLAR
jgi:hypothetical protein